MPPPLVSLSTSFDSTDTYLFDDDSSVFSVYSDIKKLQKTGIILSSGNLSEYECHEQINKIRHVNDDCSDKQDEVERIVPLRTLSSIFEKNHDWIKLSNAHDATVDALFPSTKKKFEDDRTLPSSVSSLISFDGTDTYFFDDDSSVSSVHSDSGSTKEYNHAVQNEVNSLLLEEAYEYADSVAEHTGESDFSNDDHFEDVERNCFFFSWINLRNMSKINSWLRTQDNLELSEEIFTA
mmetsp:Transcript_12902/g.28506  ORF Transcript_12902/g.28506 Transcript_12902/m.28506 type:complete len:237 (-) Transcript_12902:28-738(-)